MFPCSKEHSEHQNIDVITNYKYSESRDANSDMFQNGIEEPKPHQNRNQRLTEQTMLFKSLRWRVQWCSASL